ncbi:MAG: DUF2264 domain-containing protein [Anaerolineae bacterium]|nr:DUF2264 domain-containing protein [Anaerolineae bacterium]
MHNPNPFTRQEAVELWARLVAGWADHLDNSGARTLLDGCPTGADAGGSYEGVTRMFWGLGGWLSQPGRTPLVRWRDKVYDLSALMVRGIANGCDPSSPSYWGIEYSPGREYDQRTVESGQVAFALWQTRKSIWEQLTDTERTHIYHWLERFGRRPTTWHGNWSLFWVVNHACRKALDLPYDQGIIDEVMYAYLDGVYCGDGWYDDAPVRGSGFFDEYNTWVFGSHVLAWAQVDGAAQPGRRDELLERVRQWMRNYPYFFAANGAYSEFGRSLSYKFARLGTPLWAYKLGVWPHSAGMLKRLVGRHLRWYVDRGAVRADGTLCQSLTETGSVEIAETYISTGATYWAMQAFGGLWNLADDDPFWEAEEEPLPAEAGDYVKVFPQPGWVVTATDGAVQRFNGGSIRAHGYGAKYAKLVYSTQHPFNVGLTDGFSSPDGTLCLIDGDLRGERTKNLGCAVGEPGWLHIHWEQALNGLTHVIDTVIVVRGGQHVRAHRITLDPATSSPIRAIEGGAPLGTIQGEVPTILSGPCWQAAGSYDHAVAVRGLRGYDRARLWTGAPGINSVYPFALVPVLQVEAVQPQHDLLCQVFSGVMPDQKVLPEATITAEWQADGSVHLVWDGQIYQIPALNTKG